MKRAFTLIELLIVIAIIAILALIAIPNFIEAQTRAKVSRCHADMRTVATALEAYFVDNNAYPRVDWRDTRDHSYHCWSKRMYFDVADGGAGARCEPLTTPIPYLTQRPPVDPFLDKMEESIYAINSSYYYYNFLGAARHCDLYRDIVNPGDWIMYEYVVSPAPLKFNTPPPWVPAAVSNATPTNYCNYALVSAGPDRSFECYNDGVPGVNRDARGMIRNSTGWNWLEKGTSVIYDPTNGTISSGMIWRLGGGGKPQ